ncbi:hypothetical protein CYMTET_37677 [Cymbomonas tetramitiformis]|uniref:AAA+ ATPase domain-containing protein n=1 Tax=Cymbomonas tetramitiformis TaxID=36881 RepID=A0AAE0CES5_9CHLO|nr:hypothetical protein CYMTET_37677 [Cymbomonas tetramitiformis]
MDRRKIVPIRCKCRTSTRSLKVRVLLIDMLTPSTVRWTRTAPPGLVLSLRIELEGSPSDWSSEFVLKAAPNDPHIYTGSVRLPVQLASEENFVYRYQYTSEDNIGRQTAVHLICFRGCKHQHHVDVFPCVESYWQGQLQNATETLQNLQALFDCPEQQRKFVSNVTQVLCNKAALENVFDKAFESCVDSVLISTSRIVHHEVATNVKKLVQDALLDMPACHLELMLVGLSKLQSDIPGPRLVQKAAEFYESFGDFKPIPGLRVRNTGPLKNTVERVFQSHRHILLLPLRDRIPKPLQSVPLPRDGKYSPELCSKVLQLESVTAHALDSQPLGFLRQDDHSWQGFIPALLFLDDEPDVTAVNSGAAFGLTEMALVLATRCTTAPKGLLGHPHCWLQVARALLSRAQVPDRPPGLGHAAERLPQGFVLALSSSVNVIIQQSALPPLERFRLAFDTYTFTLSRSREARFQDMKYEAFALRDTLRCLVELISAVPYPLGWIQNSSQVWGGRLHKEIAEHRNFHFCGAALEQLHVPHLLSKGALNDWCRVDPQLVAELAAKVPLKSLLDKATAFQWHPLGRRIVVLRLTAVFSEASRALWCRTPPFNATSDELLALTIFGDHAVTLVHGIEITTPEVIALDLKLFSPRVAELMGAYRACREQISEVAWRIASGYPDTSMSFAEPEEKVRLMDLLRAHHRVDSLRRPTAIQPCDDAAPASCAYFEPLPPEDAVEQGLQKIACMATTLWNVHVCHQSILKLFSAALSESLVQQVASFRGASSQSCVVRKVKLTLDRLDKLWAKVSGSVLVHEMHLIKTCCPPDILSGFTARFAAQPIAGYDALMAACRELRRQVLNVWQRLEEDDLSLEDFNDECMVPEVMSIGCALAACKVPDVRGTDQLLECTEPVDKQLEAGGRMASFTRVRGAMQLLQEVRELSTAAEALQVTGAESLHEAARFPGLEAAAEAANTSAKPTGGWLHSLGRWELFTRKKKKIEEKELFTRKDSQAGEMKPGRHSLDYWDRCVCELQQAIPIELRTASGSAREAARALGHCQPLMRWLEESMLVDDGAFREYLERGMDLAALDGSLARALQDLRKARGGLLALKCAPLLEFLRELQYVDAAALKYAGGALGALQGLHRELTQSTSVRVIHKLQAMEEGVLGVCVEKEVFLPVGQAGACVDVRPSSGARMSGIGTAMSTEACEEVLAQLAMGDLAEGTAQRVEAFGASLQAAVALAAEVLGARLQGEPHAQGTVQCLISKAGSAEALAEIQGTHKEWRERKRQWRRRVREKQAGSLSIACLPVRVALARSSSRSEHYLTDAWLSLPPQFKHVAPPPASASQGELLTWAPPGQPVAYVAGLGHRSSAFTLLLDLFRRAVNRLPFRSEVLLCTVATTATDVDSFVIRVLTAEGLLHAVVRPEELSPSLQHRLLTKLAKWRASPTPKWLRAPPSAHFHLLAVGGAGAGGILLEHFERTVLEEASGGLAAWVQRALQTRAPHAARMVTSTQPGAGKSKWIAADASKATGSARRVTVTMCGEASAAALLRIMDCQGSSGSTPPACSYVIRVGAAVTGPIESLLFELLVLQCVVGAGGEVIPRLLPTYVETDMILGFCALLPTTCLLLAGEAQSGESTQAYTQTRLTKRMELRLVTEALALQGCYHSGVSWEMNIRRVRSGAAVGAGPHAISLRSLEELVRGGEHCAVPYTIMLMLTLHMHRAVELIRLCAEGPWKRGGNSSVLVRHALLLAKHTAWALVGEKFAAGQPPAQHPNLDFMREVCPTAPAVAALQRSVYSSNAYHSFVYSEPLAEKLLAVKLRMDISAPVVIEGHTGCGKTTLVQRLCELEGRRLIHIRVHGGYDAGRVQRELREALREAGRHHAATGHKVVLFLDEVNTSPAVDLLKDFICDRRIEGAHMNELLGAKGEKAVCVVSAINPYQERTPTEMERFRHMGLRVMAHAADPGGGSDLARLVYRVHPLPPTLQHYVYRFGDMPRDLETTCIREQLRGLPEELGRAAAAAHFFMRSSIESDSRFVSFRDVKHCREAFEFAVGTAAGLALPVAAAAAVAVSVAYAVKLESRSPLYELLEREGGLPTARADYLAAQKEMLKDMAVPQGVCVNEALAENVFMMVVAIQLQRPLFVVGPPGSSKSLAKTVVTGSMLGARSASPLLRRLCSPQLRTLQCSPHTSTADLEAHFAAARGALDAVVVLEEVGLAEMSPEMPLKLLHERFDAEDKCAFMGLSNWQLDPAKMNRCLFVARSMPTATEMVVTARQLLGEGMPGKLGPLRALCEAFLEVARLMAAKPEFPEGAFYALRDIYSCVKLLAKRIDADPGRGLRLPLLLHAVHRNFAGLPPGPQAEVDALLTERLRAAATAAVSMEAGPAAPLEPRPGSLLLVREAFDDPATARYPLLICQQPVMGALAALRTRGLIPEEALVLCGSGFSRDCDARYLCKVVKQIKQCLAAGRALVLVNLDVAYESLYDMLNKFYTVYNGRNHVDISMGTGMVMKAEVHPEFQCLVLASAEDAYAKFPPPLLNRFEKHRQSPGDVSAATAATMANLRAWAKKEILEGCVGVNLCCDESMAMLVTTCDGSLEAAQQVLQQVSRAPCGSRSSLEFFLHSRVAESRPALVTVADCEDLRENLTLLERQRGHVCVHVRDYAMHEHFLSAIELATSQVHAAGDAGAEVEQSRRYLLVSVGCDDPKLFADVENVFRGMGARRVVLVASECVRRSLDGYWDHVHVDTVRREAWHGLDAALDGSLHEAMAAMHLDAWLGRPSPSEIDALLYRQVPGKVWEQVPGDERWAMRWAVTTSSAATAAVGYVIEQIAAGTAALRLEAWARECAALEACLSAGDEGGAALWCYLANRAGEERAECGFAFSDVLQRELDIVDLRLPLEELVASAGLPAVTLPAEASLRYLKDVSTLRAHVAHEVARHLFEDELSRLIAGHALMRCHPGGEVVVVHLRDCGLNPAMTAQEVWKHLCFEEEEAEPDWLEEGVDSVASCSDGPGDGRVVSIAGGGEGGHSAVFVGSSVWPADDDDSSDAGADPQLTSAVNWTRTAAATGDLLVSDSGTGGSRVSPDNAWGDPEQSNVEESNTSPLAVARANDILGDIISLLEPTCEDAAVAHSVRHLGEMVGRAVAVLATDLSTASSSHFLFELLQNFDDNRYAQGVLPCVAIVQQDGPLDGLLFANNEVGFSEADVRALCNIGDSTKKGRRGFIGEKGLGFKAVFSASRSPMMVSGDYRFKFDLDAGRPLSHLLPIPLSPAEVAQLRGLCPGTEDEWTTLIYLPGASAAALDHLDPVTLLFFRRLQEIRVRAETAPPCRPAVTWRKDGRSAPVFKLTSERREMRFTVFRHECSLQGHVSAERAHVDASEIVLALPHHDSALPHSACQVYNFLPVRDVGLPFVVNVDLLLTAAREDIQGDSDWNLRLRDELPSAFCAVLQAFKTAAAANAIPRSFLEFVPCRRRVTHPFFAPVVPKILDRVRRLACVQTWAQGWAQPEEALWCPEPRVRRFLAEELDMPAAIGMHVAEGLHNVPRDTLAALSLKRVDLSWALESVVACHAACYAEAPDTLFLKVLELRDEVRHGCLCRCALWPVEGGGSLARAAELVLGASRRDGTEDSALLGKRRLRTSLEAQLSGEQLGALRALGASIQQAEPLLSRITAQLSHEEALDYFLEHPAALQDHAHELGHFLLRTEAGNMRPASQLYLSGVLLRADAADAQSATATDAAQDAAPPGLHEAVDVGRPPACDWFLHGGYPPKYSAEFFARFGVSRHIQVDAVAGVLDRRMTTADVLLDACKLLRHVDAHWDALRPNLGSSWGDALAGLMVPIRAGGLEIPVRRCFAQDHDWSSARRLGAYMPWLPVPLRHLDLRDAIGVISAPTAQDIADWLRTLEISLPRPRSQEEADMLLTTCASAYAHIAEHSALSSGDRRHIPIYAPPSELGATGVSCWHLPGQCSWMSALSAVAEGSTTREAWAALCWYYPDSLRSFFISQGVRGAQPLTEAVLKAAPHDRKILYELLVRLNGESTESYADVALLPIVGQEALAPPSRDVVVCDLLDHDPLGVAEACPGLLMLDIAPEQLSSIAAIIAPCRPLSELLTAEPAEAAVDDVPPKKLRADEMERSVPADPHIAAIHLVQQHLRIHFRDRHVADHVSTPQGVDLHMPACAGFPEFSAKAPDRDYEANVERLRRSGAEVRFDVDATALNAEALLQSAGHPPRPSFDFIVMNFPHTGVRQACAPAAQMRWSVQSNRALLTGLFRSAASVLSPNGRLHVTIKSTAPYTSWQLPECAAAEGWQCLRVFAFPFEQFQELGYHHQTTLKLPMAVRLNGACTYEFVRYSSH